MTPLCLLAGGKAVVLGLGFTLGWIHSVEHTGWRETWAAAPGGMVLTLAQVRGSGAGMDPGPGARLVDGGWWVWQPDLPVQPELRLAASGATGAGWEVCGDAGCRVVGATPGAPVRIAPCGS